MTEFNYTFGFHDLTPMGIIAFVLYLLAGSLCLINAFFLRDDFEWGGMWLLAGSFLWAMGINKQFDLHNLISALGRVISAQQGWYDSRRTIQFIVIGTLILVGLVVAAVLVKVFWESIIEHQVMLIGFVILIGVIIFQASSFHHFNPLGFLVEYALFDLIEMVALALIGVDAGTFIYEFLTEEDEEDEMRSYSRIA